MKTLALALVLSAAAGSSANAALVYGGGTETVTRFNPGAGVIAYMNCFTPITGGNNQLVLESVEVGIRRLTTAGLLTDVGLNIYAAEMTFDGTNFGRGTNTLLFSTNSLGGGTVTATQLVSTGTISGPTLNLETTSNPGLGGWWIGVEFTGANASNTINGWRVTNAPTTGASINSFGLFNNASSGVFQAFFGFGSPPGSSPSRFLTNVNGTLVPAPGAVALLGLGGVAAVRRRRAR
jgi:hypothetical protein